jgi:NADH dehydrogenase
VELAAEIHAVQTEICRDYPNLSRDDVRVTIVENSDRILGALRPEAAAYCQGTLQLRGVRFRLKSGVTAVTAEGAVIGPDDQIAAETVYWTAGVAPSPLLSAIPGLPLNERGYIRTEASLQVEGLTNVWAIGDSAAVLDPEGKPYAATAQNAIRQGPLAADNLLVGLRKGKAAPFRYRPMGSFTIIGRHKAVAELNGRLFYGFLAWLLFRGAYLTKIPGFAAKLRLIFDWTLELILPPTAVQFGMGPRDSRAG